MQLKGNMWAWNWNNFEQYLKIMWDNGSDRVILKKMKIELNVKNSKRKTNSRFGNKMKNWNERKSEDKFDVMQLSNFQFRQIWSIFKFKSTCGLHREKKHREGVVEHSQITHDARALAM